MSVFGGLEVVALLASGRVEVGDAGQVLGFRVEQR